jgi:hypothetical protein
MLGDKTCTYIFYLKAYVTLLTQCCRLHGINNERCIGLGAEETFHGLSQHLLGGVEESVENVSDSQAGS